MDERKQNNLPAARWENTCKILNKWFGMFSGDIEEDMLISSWPGHSNIWKDGDDLIYIDFMLEAHGDCIVDFTFKTLWSPVPWQAFPMLLEIFKDTSLTRIDNYGGDIISESVKTFQKESAKTAAPYAINWRDWNDGDNLEVACCPAKEWMDDMTFRNGYLRQILEEYADTYDDFKVYIGRCEADFQFDFISMYNVEDLIIELKKFYNMGYEPLILQTSTDSNEKMVVCFWIWKGYNLEVIQQY